MIFGLNSILWASKTVQHSSWYYIRKSSFYKDRPSFNKMCSEWSRPDQTRQQRKQRQWLEQRQQRQPQQRQQQQMKEQQQNWQYNEDNYNFNLTDLQSRIALLLKRWLRQLCQQCWAWRGIFPLLIQVSLMDEQREESPPGSAQPSGIEGCLTPQTSVSTGSVTSNPPVKKSWTNILLMLTQLTPHSHSRVNVNVNVKTTCGYEIAVVTS